MVRIALTREDGLNDPLEQAIRAHYMKYVSVFDDHLAYEEVPAIEQIRGPDFGRLSRLWDKHEFDSCVLIGTEAAKIFCDQTSVAYERLIAVGKGTAEVLQRERKTVTPVPEKASEDGSGLAKYLPSTMGPRLLLLCSVQQKDECKTTLEERGFDVTVMQVYGIQARTEPAHKPPDNIDIWTFGSATAVRGVAQWSGVGVKVAICVNKQTARTAHEHFGESCVVECAEKSGVKSWAAKVVDFMQKGASGNKDFLVRDGEPGAKEGAGGGSAATTASEDKKKTEQGSLSRTGSSGRRFQSSSSSSSRREEDPLARFLAGGSSKKSPSLKNDPLAGLTFGGQKTSTSATAGVSSTSTTTTTTSGGPTSGGPTSGRGVGGGVGSSTTTPPTRPAPPSTTAGRAAAAITTATSPAKAELSPEKAGMEPERTAPEESPSTTTTTTTTTSGSLGSLAGPTVPSSSSTATTVPSSSSTATTSTSTGMIGSSSALVATTRTPGRVPPALALRSDEVEEAIVDDRSRENSKDAPPGGSPSDDLPAGSTGVGGGGSTGAANKGKTAPPSVATAAGKVAASRASAKSSASTAGGRSTTAQRMRSPDKGDKTISDLPSSKSAGSRATTGSTGTGASAKAKASSSSSRPSTATIRPKAAASSTRPPTRGSRPGSAVAGGTATTNATSSSSTAAATSSASKPAAAATATRAKSKEGNSSGATWEEVDQLWQVIGKWESSFADLKLLHENEVRQLREQLRSRGGMTQSTNPQGDELGSPSRLGNARSVLEMRPAGSRFESVDDASEQYEMLRQEYEDFRKAKNVEIELLHTKLNAADAQKTSYTLQDDEIRRLREENLALAKQVEHFTLYATV
ncbi:unnamed protein product [Amoebophrya sp. A25]|nr:unnamed protein product [Amoebophrya sp. A25]|eukprot:GSA25T00003669001.1